MGPWPYGRGPAGRHGSLQVPPRQPRRFAISGCAAEISATQSAIQPSKRPGINPSAITVMVQVHGLDVGIDFADLTARSLLRRNSANRDAGLPHRWLSPPAYPIAEATGSAKSPFWINCFNL